MNKRDARKRAYAGDYTWEDLRELVQECSTEGASSLNPQFSKSEILKILSDGIAEKSGSIDTPIDLAVATNVFRECA